MEQRRGRNDRSRRVPGGTSTNGISDSVKRRRASSSTWPPELGRRFADMSYNGMNHAADVPTVTLAPGRRRGRKGYELSPRSRLRSTPPILSPLSTRPLLPRPPRCPGAVSSWLRSRGTSAWIPAPPRRACVGSGPAEPRALRFASHPRFRAAHGSFPRRGLHLYQLTVARPSTLLSAPATSRLLLRCGRFTPARAACQPRGPGVFVSDRLYSRSGRGRCGPPPG